MNIDNHRRDRELQSDLDEPEREISLGTATIFGIFLALALVCAAFFGFGYSLGHHSVASAVPLTADSKPDTAPAPATDSPFKNFKTGSAPSKADDVTASETLEVPVVRKVTAISPAKAIAFPVPSQPAPNASDPVVTTTGQFVVQISAPSRQGDADALMAALSRRGYKAYIRKEPQDSFFHVQVGPYATKPEAQAMVKRLDTDGYKPFIK